MLLNKDKLKLDIGINKLLLSLIPIWVLSTFCLSVTAQNILEISDGSLFENKAFYPQFDWDTTPMYSMFGDSNRVLTTKEI